MYNLIKSRMALLGIKGTDIIEEIYRTYNVKVDAGQFSRAIKNIAKSPKEEQICEWVEKILTEKEAEVHNN